MSWRNPGFKQSTFAHQTRDSLKNQMANPHNTFVGVLELVLPSPFQGGALRIRHQQREKQFLYPAFDPAQATATGASHFIPRNCIAWTAFFGEACFCVSPIVEDETTQNGGSRVSLIYFLFRESHPPPDPYVDHLLLRVHMLQEQLRQALQSPNFFPAGGRLHLRMRHLYDERHIAVTEEKMLVCFRESSGPVSIQGRFNLKYLHSISPSSPTGGIFVRVSFVIVPSRFSFALVLSCRHSTQRRGCCISRDFFGVPSRCVHLPTSGDRS